MELFVYFIFVFVFVLFLSHQESCLFNGHILQFLNSKTVLLPCVFVLVVLGLFPCFFNLTCHWLSDQFFYKMSYSLDDLVISSELNLVKDFWHKLCRGDVGSFSARDTWCSCVLLLVMQSLISWLSCCLLEFSIVKAFFLFIINK